MFDFQFPYFLTDAINRRITEGAKGRVKNEAEIMQRIKEFCGSRQRLDMIIGENYYIGKHDITRRRRTAIGEYGELEEIDNIPNNRVVDNQYRKMVDQKVNYIVGKPFTFNSDDKRYLKLVKKLLDAEFYHCIKNVARDSLNCGIGWLFVNYDQNGEMAFKRIKPWELVPVWGDEEHKRLEYAVRFYDVCKQNGKKREVIRKIEVFDSSGISRYYEDRGRLIPDGKNSFTAYFKSDDEEGSWGRIPIIAFKYNENELPLIKNVKTLQDGLNLLMSNLQNQMEEDVRNTILVLKNYDGEDLGEFRKNLATYGAVKVRTVDSSQGGVDTLNIQVDSNNYKCVIDLFKKAIIENAMGFDAKDDRLMGQPNQMNIKSMYSDIDLDTNSIEMEYKSGLKQLFYFVDSYFSQKHMGDFFDKEKEFIFNRDILINEGDVIDNCIKSMAVLSLESVVAKHPWVENVEKELKRIEKSRAAEKQNAAENGENDSNDENADKKSTEKERV